MIQLKSMGSMEDIASMLPGMGGKKLDLNIDEKQLAKTEAIIQSMTPYERENPSVLNSSRKKRIAAGSGTQVVDVNRLLKQFDQIQQLTRQFSNPKKAKGLMGRIRGMGLPF
jgi:signal recognition particle subunit SRP54